MEAADTLDHAARLAEGLILPTVVGELDKAFGTRHPQAPTLTRVTPQGRFDLPVS